MRAILFSTVIVALWAGPAFAGPAAHDPIAHTRKAWTPNAERSTDARARDVPTLGSAYAPAPAALPPIGEPATSSKPWLLSVGVLTQEATAGVSAGGAFETGAEPKTENKSVALVDQTGLVIGLSKAKGPWTFGAQGSYAMGDDALSKTTDFGADIGAIAFLDTVAGLGDEITLGAGSLAATTSDTEVTSSDLKGFVAYRVVGAKTKAKDKGKEKAKGDAKAKKAKSPWKVDVFAAGKLARYDTDLTQATELTNAALGAAGVTTTREADVEQTRVSLTLGAKAKVKLSNRLALGADAGVILGTEDGDLSASQTTLIDAGALGVGDPGQTVEETLSKSEDRSFVESYIAGSVSVKLTKTASLALRGGVKEADTFQFASGFDSSGANVLKAKEKDGTKTFADLTLLVAF